MSTQIFKNIIPSEKLFNLLDSLCIKNNKHYFFDSNSFKKFLIIIFIINQ